MERGGDAAISRLRGASSSLSAILRASGELEGRLAESGGRISLKLEALADASGAVAPLRAQSMAARALDSRISRAVTPALSLLRSFSLAESLQRRLSRGQGRRGGGLPALLEYVGWVERLEAAVGSVTAGCEPAVQRLQEAVEFLGRTKAAEARRLRRLREAVRAVRVLYQGEVDEMRYEGLLDVALLRLQEEYEGLLLQLRHDDKVGVGEEEEEEEVEVPREGDEGGAGGDAHHHQLGSDMEVEVLRRIAETLAHNDCLDICIDIFVKVRYRAAAKALLRLSPDYLRRYAPEDVDAMEWESLESAVSLWLRHLHVAVLGVLAAERRLCGRVLAAAVGDEVWPECFAKVADKIMAVFFRFGEGVARSAKHPHKLFKLLDMSASLDRMHPAFAGTFDGPAGGDIRGRFRELQKLLVHAAAKVFWEFGLQIEGSLDGAPPPPDASVPKLVRYTVNYLKCLAGEGYSGAMGKVLRTQQAWNASASPGPAASDETLLRDAMASVMDALCRNVEAKRSLYDDRVLPHVLAMNTYWYVYTRTRGTELGRLLGDHTLRKRYKATAEAAAYSYQSQAWGPLVKLLERGEAPDRRRATTRGAAAAVAARKKVEAFLERLEGGLRWHEGRYCIPDEDLREQVREAVTELVVTAYAGFLRAHASALQEGPASLPAPDSVGRMLAQLFDGKDQKGLLHHGGRR